MMQLKETGFTFAGKHSRRDFGLIYAEDGGHPVIPEIERNEYEIAGMDGTVLLTGERRKPMEFGGVLYVADERSSQKENQALLRLVSRWLTVGRARLIFDYEPDVFYMAQLKNADAWSLEHWFGGELPITFLAQPYAYNVAKDSITATVTTTDTTITLPVHTGASAPLQIDITNTGSASIGWIRIGDGIDLSGLNLTRGQTLSIDLEPPIGAVIGSANALPYAVSFGPMAMVNGDNQVRIRMTPKTGSAIQAQVVLSARGRW